MLTDASDNKKSWRSVNKPPTTTLNHVPNNKNETDPPLGQVIGTYSPSNNQQGISRHARCVQKGVWNNKMEI